MEIIKTLRNRGIYFLFFLTEKKKKTAPLSKTEISINSYATMKPNDVAKEKSTLDIIFNYLDVEFESNYDSVLFLLD